MSPAERPDTSPESDICIEPCEGGCGCHVALWREGMWEITTRAVDDAPHHPQRCRAIRALREAGEQADGDRGRTVVTTSREGARDLLTVRTGGRPGTSDRWADVTWSTEYVVESDPERLSQLAAVTTAQLIDILDGRAPQRDYPTGTSVVARSL